MSDIVTSLLPICFILKHTGLLSFRIDCSTKAFISAKISMYAAIFFNLLMTLSYSLRLFVHEEENTSKFAETLIKFYIFMDVTKNITVIISAFTFKEATLALWKNLILLDREFLDFGIKLNYATTKWSGVVVLMVYALFKVAFIPWLVLLGSFRSRPQLIIPYSVFLLGDLVYFVAKAYYLTFLYVFLDYLRKLARCVADTSRFSAGDILKVQKLCSQLCIMKNTFIKILSPNTVMFIAKTTSELIVQLYNVVSKFYASRNTNIVHFNLDVSFQCLLDSCFVMAVIIAPAYLYTSSAASLKRALRNICIYNGNPAIVRDIKSFALQLMHEDFKITAGGLFNIDLGLAYMIAGALTTYITIIVQFDISYLQ